MIRPGRTIAAGVLVAAAAAGGVTYFVTRSPARRVSQSQRVRRSGGSRRPGGSSGSGSGGAPFRVVSTTPHSGASGVSGTARLSITFSQPVSKSSPMPKLNPSVPGNWQVKGRRLVFKPTTAFVPLSQETLTIPGGQGGLVDAAGKALSGPVSDNFTVENGSILRLQQLLSLLDYSPLAWQPAGPAIAPSDSAAQLQAMYSPPAGSFSWRDSGWPARLQALWQEGSYNVFTRGLVMEFQADHGLIVNGQVSGGLWNALLLALSNGSRNTGGYNYAIASKAPPESLTIWHNGQVVFRSPANTGIPQSPTPSGNFNVYARYRNEIMKGTNPNGTPYADPVQFVAYFHDGDAVHYFPRAAYGIPQSLGCVELPLAEAARAWPYLAYGTIVSVVN